MDNNAYQMTTGDKQSDPSTQPPAYQPLVHGYPTQAAPFTTAPYPQNYPPSSDPAMQPYVPPTGAYPYYPQSGAVNPGYPVATYQDPMSPQNPQQQQVIVVGNQPLMSPVIISPGSTVSLTGAIIMSCLVYWFCGWLFGGIAFILAMVGQSNAASGDVRGAIQLRNASYGLSIAGIVLGVISIAIIIGVMVSAAKRYSSYYSYYNYNYYNTYYKQCYSSYGSYGYYYSCLN